MQSDVRETEEIGIISDACVCAFVRHCAQELICFMVIVMNEQCVYELQASSSLSANESSFPFSHVHIWHLVLSHRIQSLNLPIFTGPQWIDESWMR